MYRPAQSRSLRQQTTRVNCPFADCQRELHPNSLSNHIKTKHAANGRKRIDSTRFLNGTCVDISQGIYLVRKQLRGTDHPIHCQFKTTWPTSILCSVDTCQQHSNTACRSGQSDFLCDHLKSTQFIGTSAVIADHLKEESLDFVVNRLKWLKTERRSECLHWQNQARINNVPLVVQMPITPDSSARFIHFSMFANIKREHYWSFCKRVVVSFDKESCSFHCKCCPSRRSCMHKCIVKWAIGQWHPSVIPTSSKAVMDEEESVDMSGPDFCSMNDDTSIADMDALVEDDITSISNSDSMSYPPTGDVSTKFVKYLLTQKKIPAELPLALTVQKETFGKR